ELGLVDCNACHRQRAARMSDEHGSPDTDRRDETVGMLNDGIHRVVGVTFGIIGESHPELIEGVDTEACSQVIEDRPPAIGGGGRRPLAPIHQYQSLAPAAFEIARAYAPHLHEFPPAHKFP